MFKIKCTSLSHQITKMMNLNVNKRKVYNFLNKPFSNKFNGKEKSDYSEEMEEIEYENRYVDNDYKMQKMEKIQKLDEKAYNFLRTDEEEFAEKMKLSEERDLHKDMDKMKGNAKNFRSN
jgi:hypothetical protein